MNKRPWVIPSIITMLCTALLPAASGRAPRAAERVDAEVGRGRAGTSFTVLPEDGRDIYFRAIDAARREIRIEICVLEDPQILERLQGLTTSMPCYDCDLARHPRQQSTGRSTMGTTRASSGMLLLVSVAISTTHSNDSLTPVIREK